MPLGAAKAALMGAAGAGGDVDYWVPLSTVTLGTDTTYINFSWYGDSSFDKYQILKFVGGIRGANTGGLANSLNVNAPGGNSWTSSSNYMNNAAWNRTSGSGASGCKLLYANGGGTHSHPYNQTAVEFYLEKRNAAQQGGSISTGPYVSGYWSDSRSDWYSQNALMLGFVQVYVGAEATSMRFGMEQYGQNLEAGSQITMYGLDFEA